MPHDHLDDVQFEEVDGQPLYCNVRYIDERELSRDSCWYRPDVGLTAHATCSLSRSINPAVATDEGPFWGRRHRGTTQKRLHRLAAKPSPYGDTAVPELSLAIRHSSYFYVILYAALWILPALRQRVQT